MNFLELLKNKSFLSLVIKKKENSIILKENESDETYVNLLDDSRSTNLSISSSSKFSKNLCKLSILPTLYLILNILIIFLLLYIKKRRNIIYSTDFTRNSITIANFYHLTKVCPSLFKIYSSTTSLIGLILVSILFSALKQRFKVPEFKNHYYKLYVLLAFGYLSNFFNFATVLIPYFVNLEDLDNELSKEIQIELNQLIFLTMIFFSVSFAIYSLFCLTLIREKQPEINVEKDNLLSYKMLIIVFLSIITLIYILAILYQDCGLIRDLIHENQSEFYKNILSYIIYILFTY